MTNSRRYDRNPGFLSLMDIPDDKEIVAAVIVLKDDAGDYSSVMVPVDQDAMPSPETQDLIGGHTATAFELAGMGVTS
ncbi:hypothetical protein SEA_FRANSOYER_62 [Microbacterium phage Fransoyer]|nr:hypothetical protein SEA_FRANSOYER_62 [Microbacterium phage Fransoyer]